MLAIPCNEKFLDPGTSAALHREPPESCHVARLAEQLEIGIPLLKSHGSLGLRRRSGCRGGLLT